MALGIGIFICIKVCSKGKGRTRVKSSEPVENVHWHLIDDFDQNSKRPHLKNVLYALECPLHLNTCGLKLSAYSAYSSYSIFNQCVCTMCFPVATWLRKKRIRYKILQDIWNLSGKKGVDLDGFFGSKSYSCNSLKHSTCRNTESPGESPGITGLDVLWEIVGTGKSKRIVWIFWIFCMIFLYVNQWQISGPTMDTAAFFVACRFP